MKTLAVIISTIGLSTLAFAAPKGSGPVAEKCKDEIEKFCSDKSHVGGQVRSCLETKKAELSPACQEALDTTGPGKGKGKQGSK